MADRPTFRQRYHLRIHYRPHRPPDRGSGRKIDHVTILRTKLGKDKFIDLAAVFFAKLKNDLRARSADPNMARANAFHALRGVVSNLGLTSFCKFYQRLEHRERPATKADLDSLIRLLSAGLAALAHSISQLDSEI